MFGKYEARIKIPKGWGLWPAFWLYGDGHIGNEIDVFEFVNETPSSNLAKKQHMTVHYDYNHDGHVDDRYYEYLHEDMSLKYHIYTLVYLPGYIKWMVDGNTLAEHYRYYEYYNFPERPVECEIIGGSIYMENKLFPFPPMNVIFNTAVQYGQGNEPNGNTILPAQMEVDWFRYYVSANNILVQTKDIQQQYLNNDINNAYAGYDVRLDTLIIPSEAQINIIALNEVVLQPGFEAESGSDVKILIHQTSPQQMTYANTLQNSEELEELEICLQQNDIPDVSIFPNPTSGNVTISFPDNIVNNGEILIFSSNGELLRQNAITEKTILQNINYAPGIYILAIRNLRDNTVSSFKIIVK